MAMDEKLIELVDLSCNRGNNYVKGAASFNELPEKMAELGVLLLEKSKIIAHSENDRLKEELIDLQNKIDDMRKTLFANKLLIK